MDRIRKALDLAREERAQALQAQVQVLPMGSEPELAPAAAPAAVRAFNATAAHRPLSPDDKAPRSRPFRPAPEVLERNRILSADINDPAAVAYRMLRTQVLQRMDANGWRTLGVFSPGSRDGKTTTAANLAISLASDHLHTVLLVEFDLRRPTLATRFGFTPEFGVEDALLGRASIAQSLYLPEGYSRLVLMPGREGAGNSSELLAGPRSREIVQELRSRYTERIVVFDLPPVLAADDALAFAPLIECGLVVASEGNTRRKDLARTIELLHKVPLLGTVLNRAARAPAGY